MDNSEYSSYAFSREEIVRLDCSQRDAMQGANCAAWLFSRKQFVTRQCARWGQSNQTIPPAQGISMDAPLLLKCKAL
jgi:hypothetical protein